MVAKKLDDLKVEVIPIEQIQVINPRNRDKAKFNQIVSSMPEIGIKRPIIVSRRKSNKSKETGYDLVCGQGRLEAFAELGQKEIPAIIIDVSKKQRLQMSLVENIARRHNNYLELTRNLLLLKERGCSNLQISQKTGLSEPYVGSILKLLEEGEERLVDAVAAGRMPISAALEIMKLDDAQLQSWLSDAYESGELKVSELRATRRIAESRLLMGKSKYKKRGYKLSGKDALIRDYQKKSEIIKLQVKKSELHNNRRLAIEGAFRRLLADDNFKNLLRAEGLNDLPRFLSEAALKDG